MTYFARLQQKKKIIIVVNLRKDLTGFYKLYIITGVIALQDLQSTTTRLELLKAALVWGSKTCKKFLQYALYVLHSAHGEDIEMDNHSDSFDVGLATQSSSG